MHRVLLFACVAFLLGASALCEARVLQPSGTPKPQPRPTPTASGTPSASGTPPAAGTPAPPATPPVAPGPPTPPSNANKPPPPGTPQPVTPPAVPVTLGKYGNPPTCGSPSKADFIAGDNPTLQGLSAQALVALHNGQSDSDLEGIMLNSPGNGIQALGGPDGEAAARRFFKGGGAAFEFTAGTAMHNKIKDSPVIKQAGEAARQALEAQLKTQRANCARLDTSKLVDKVIPMQISFPLNVGGDNTLKAIIGGTQGGVLVLTSLTPDCVNWRWTATAEFRVCDNFGVDESDIYTPSLAAFWILQHRRAKAGSYQPYVHRFTVKWDWQGNLY